jgi:hypothetical protein
VGVLTIVWVFSSYEYVYLYLFCFVLVVEVCPLSAGNTFQDLLRLREIADSTECSIRVTYINTIKLN